MGQEMTASKTENIETLLLLLLILLVAISFQSHGSHSRVGIGIFEIERWLHRYKYLSCIYGRLHLNFKLNDNNVLKI